MALSRSNRAARKRPLPVALYSLFLPPLFLAWQSAFDVSFTELGLAVALMPGASAILPDASRLRRGSLWCPSFPDRWCIAVGLDYVSCSRFRVPVARVAAAQAALEVGSDRAA